MSSPTDFDSLWDCADPVETEKKFREALAEAESQRLERLRQLGSLE